jgi:putative heme iron utilization protein
MDADVLRAIGGMLTARKVLCLAAVIDGEPAASLLPFVVSPDFGAVLVQASALAKHSRALQPGAGVGLLFHEPDTDDVDPLQLPRLSVQATVATLERGTGEFDAARRAFEERLPSAAMTLDLADFTLYRLELGRGRYVAGFAQAYNVGPDTFRAVGQSTKS